MIFLPNSDGIFFLVIIKKKYECNENITKRRKKYQQKKRPFF